MEAAETFEETSDQLSQDSEDSVDSDFIDQIIAEELAKFEEDKEDDDDLNLGKPEEAKEREREDQKIIYIRQRSLLHDIVNCLDWFFSPKIMLRITLAFACFLVIGQIYNTLIEAMSRPTILKPRQSKPFFSNSSSTYVQDYFTGNTKPDLLLPKTDLLIVMFYSPWSTYSMQLKHPYQMVAKFLHVPGKVTFTAINCWAPGSLCRSSYKLMNYPVIAAYSKTASVMYTGPSETDHLYRWVVRLQNHLIPLTTSEQLEQLQASYQKILLGYFPFQNMVASCDYTAYAAAGFMLANGNPQNDAIAICTTHSLEVAAQIGIRFEGDIHLLRGSDETVTWPMGRHQSAINIMEFARKHSHTDSEVHYITKYQEIHTSSHVFDLLKRSPVLFLVTPLEPMYHQQDEIVLFSKLSEDYWKCDIKVLAQGKPSFLSTRIKTVASDQLACEELETDPIQLDGCCRSLLLSVDWNMACASSAKYRWEDEEESPKQRKHWIEEVLPLQPACTPLRVLPAGQLVHSCCSSYEKLTEPYMSDTQKSIEHERIKLKQKNLVRQCLRYKSAVYYDYKLNSSSSPFAEESNASATIQAVGCTRNDSLQFAVIDSNTEQFLLKKWGIEGFKKPLALIVDTSKELFVVMNENLSQASLQRFVHDYHGNLLNDLMLDETNTVPKFNTTTEKIEMHGIIKSQELLSKLTREAFLTLVDNGNSTIDQLVFFTGGGWHGPSTSVLYTVHTLSQYFSRTKDLIKFYTIDVSKNELPYNFNFEAVPSIVLFLAGRRDVSWKYPEMLPITMPNLISFIVSRCSQKLRWKISLLNCDGRCLSRNAHKLQRQAEKIQKELRSSIVVKNPEKILKWRDYKIHQLSSMRSLLRAISSSTKVDGINEAAIDRLLKSEHMSSIFASSQL